MTQERFNKMLIGEIASLSQHAQYYTSSVEDAEDLLQDTLLLVLEKREHYHEENFGGWTFTLLYNIFRNRTRNKAVVHCYEGIADIPFDALEADYLHDIKFALKALSTTNQEAIKLYLIGYKYDEIAMILHITEGTVKSRIHRAKQQLKATLRHYR